MQSELLAFIAESKLLLGWSFWSNQNTSNNCIPVTKRYANLLKEATSATVAAAEITIDYVCKNQVSFSMIHPSSKIK